METNEKKEKNERKLVDSSEFYGDKVTDQLSEMESAFTGPPPDSTEVLSEYEQYKADKDSGKITGVVPPEVRKKKVVGEEEEGEEDEKSSDPTKESDEGEEESDEDEESDEGEEVDELTTLKERNAALEDMLNRLARGETIEPTISEEAKEVANRTTAVVERVLPKPIEGMKELSDEEFEELFEDKDKFNSYINDVAQRARQQTLQSTGVIVQGIIETRQRVDGFFKKPENSDLTAIREFILRRAVDIESDKPGIKPEDALSQSAKEFREQIKASSSRRSREVEEKKNSARAKAGRFASPPKRKGAVKVANRDEGTTVADEIERMERALNAGG